MSAVAEAVFGLVERAGGALRGGEVLLASFAGEETDYVRLNHGRVRQAMSLRLGQLTLSLIDGLRRDTMTLTLAGDRGEDEARVGAALAAMRAALPSTPEDPYLFYSTEPATSERVLRGRLPSPAEALDTVLEAASGTDLVGIYSSGSMVRVFASSLGHRHYHEVDRCQLDYSLYHSADKAVSDAFATAEWDPGVLTARVAESRAKLELFGRPPVRLEPGEYRAFLSPAALAEIVHLFGWDGVSAMAQRTKTSCLDRLVSGEASFSPRFSMRENTRAGGAPAFDELGFAKPDLVDLVRDGQHAGAMVSPRTAREYGITANGARPSEGLEAAEVLPGDLAVGDALAVLDTGVAIGNLWYLNFSDRQNGRITGMTRFATFWVESGRIAGPVEVMRFDDTVYRLLGDNLVDLTRERDFLPSTSTYGGRSIESACLPGALISSVRFTL